MKRIDDFRKPEYSFLMNSHPATVSYDGQDYRTLEHAYQAAKTDDVAERARIRLATSARDAKKIGRGMSIRLDWDNDRIDVMYNLLSQKFKDAELRHKLLATKNSELVSGGDKFWGEVNNSGENNLGKLLMEIRADIAKEAYGQFVVHCQKYLDNCGWVRDISGDSFFGAPPQCHWGGGQCWNPPWDTDCQYSLMDAVSTQYNLSYNHKPDYVGVNDEDDSDASPWE